MFKDTELFLEETNRKFIQNGIMMRYLEIHNEILQELLHFFEKHKVPLNQENTLNKEIIDKIFEENSFPEVIKIYTSEEMSNLLNLLK